MSPTSPRNLGDLERVIGHVLQFGTVTSSACLALGLVMTLAGYGNGSARPISEVGLLILLATPAARVIVSVVEYMRERDWAFVVLTLVVLLALAGSVFAAFWGSRS